MNLDVKELVKTPKDQWEAIQYLEKAQQRIIDAIHIMESILDNPNEMPFHKKRIELFIEQFKKKNIE